MSSITSCTNSNSILSRLPANTVESMRDIVKDTFERIALSKHDAKQALKGGIWLTSDYIKAYRDLQLSEAEKRDYPPEESLNKILWGYAPETHFNRMKQPGTNKEAPLKFISKPDVSASDALDAALKGPLLIDCGAVCILAIHKALRDTLGKQWYDKQFKGKLIIGFDQEDLIKKFLQTVVSVSKNGNKVFQISSGMMISYENHSSYAQKHRFGSFCAFNLIYAGKGKYLGLGLKPEGVTEKELKVLFVEEFNKPPSGRLGGLVSIEEYQNGLMGLIFSGIIPIDEDIQINPEQVPGFYFERTLGYNYKQLGHLSFNAVRDESKTGFQVARS